MSVSNKLPLGDAAPSSPTMVPLSLRRTELRGVIGVFPHESLLRSSIIESVPASTGCAIGPGEEHEWGVRMIQVEVPRTPQAVEKVVVGPIGGPKEV
jgi:hypothetical protein